MRAVSASITRAIEDAATTTTCLTASSTFTVEVASFCGDNIAVGDCNYEMRPW